MSQVVRPFRGVPAEERRAVRREKLIDACLNVIDRDGLAGLKVSAVCQEAGLTERYFYESFSNRDDALVALFAEFGRQTYAKAVKALAAAPLDLHERSRVVASILMDALLEDPRKARAYVEAIGAEPLRELRMSYSRSYAKLLADNMIEVYSLDPHRDARILEVRSLILMAGTAEMVVHWLAGDLDATRDELVDQCTRMCVAVADEFVRNGPTAGPQ